MFDEVRVWERWVLDTYTKYLGLAIFDPLPACGGVISILVKVGEDTQSSHIYLPTCFRGSALLHDVLFAPLSKIENARLEE
jgi:hypothetical protein